LSKVTRKNINKYKQNNIRKMKNLLLIIFGWLMMISLIGSVIFFMMILLAMFFTPASETVTFLWACLIAIVLIPAYKGLYHIHSLWDKYLKEYRDEQLEEKENSLEMPFLKKETQLRNSSVVINELPPLKNKQDRANIEDVNKRIEEIRSAANDKLNKIKKEDITQPKKDGSYFVNKYTSEKSILVDTIFEKKAQQPEEDPIIEPLGKTLEEQPSNQKADIPAKEQASVEKKIEKPAPLKQGENKEETKSYKPKGKGKQNRNKRKK
jgi:hypothetical protein